MYFTSKNHTILRELIFLSLIWVVSSNLTLAQELKNMTPDVYREWKTIKNTAISDSAQTIIYTLEREIGDKQLAIYRKYNDSTIYVNRVKKAKLAPSGDFVAFTHALQYDSLRTLKRLKTPKKDMPSDSLTILSLRDYEKVTFDDVSDFTLSSEYGTFVVFTKELKKPEMDDVPSETDSLKVAQDSIPSLVQDSLQNMKTDKKSKPICTNKALFIYNFYENTVDTIENVTEYSLAEDAAELAYIQCSGDSTALYSVYKFSMYGKGRLEVMDSLASASGLSSDKKGNKLAFFGMDTLNKAAQPPLDLYLYTPPGRRASKILSANDDFVPKDWVISADEKISWSESGKRLFFGIAPLLPVQDTTLLDDEIVNVEIWRYDTPRLYTQMQSSVESDRKKTYSSMYNLTDKSFLQIEDEEVDNSMTSVKGDGRFILRIKTKPYLEKLTWTGEVGKDLELIDTETGKRTMIAIEETGNPRFSPGGNYVYWWSRKDSIWYAFDNYNRTQSVMGLWSTSTFFDEENDVPQRPGPYGIAGWLPGDSLVLVYDRYDIWLLSPSDPFYSRKMTDGRKNKEVFRYIKTDPKADYVTDTTHFFLHTFNERTKEDKYKMILSDRDTTLVLFSGPYKLMRNPIKAKKSDHLIFTKQNFETFPDLILTDTTFLYKRQISDANPQQKEYKWGTGELVSWTNYNGKKNEGMLFYPHDFDPYKKYPLIVNFYEKSSNGLHNYRAPLAGRSTISYSYYTNNDYVIFTPDVAYTESQPGEDCYNAVESGVDYIVKKGFVDKSRMALHGHSWGGYQIAYLLTKTDRYRCAESGAPVVNMVSAYGGIRWESGMSRMFQYEKTQSRLGYTLWENPEVFHNNSPIYGIPNIKTPVLILHNDNDGAVPWYQGIEFFMAMRRLNKPAWLLNYNGEPHWPVKWENRLDFNIRLEQFFNHYLKDGPMPLWMKEGNSPLEKGILNKY